jgi:hypothetical protein
MLIESDYKKSCKHNFRLETAGVVVFELFEVLVYIPCCSRFPRKLLPNIFSASFETVSLLTVSFFSQCDNETRARCSPFQISSLRNNSSGRVAYWQQIKYLFI